MSSILLTGSPLTPRDLSAGRVLRYLASTTIALTVLLAVGALSGASSVSVASTFMIGGISATPTGSAVISTGADVAPKAPDCDPDWEVVPSPNVGTDANTIYAIAVISANDVWAVGDYRNASNVVQTLTLHWNGSVWSVVQSPNVGPYDNGFRGVAAVSSSDVWAVGRYVSQNTGEYQTLVEHWDGSAWSVVSSPNVGALHNFLYGIAVVSTSDVWAVGVYETGTNTYATLTLHWNGSDWSVVTSPNPGATNFLNGVAAVSANDVWAVGYTGDNANLTLILHWNGSVWTVVPSPSPGTIRNFLKSVAAVSASDVWAVGYASGDVSSQALIEHWNGSAWSVVTSPNPGGDSDLKGVVAVSASDVWAVGSYSDGSGGHTLVEHWNGSGWLVVPSPNPSSTSTLYGVAAVSASDVWAVGDYDNGFVYRTLIERYNPCPITPTPEPTQTPGGPTATPVPPSNTPTNTPTASNTPTVTNTPTVGIPTSTPTATATQCSVQFEQVPSPNNGSGPNRLTAVAAVSANDVWAVGYYGSAGVDQTLIEHWDGTTWSIATSPNFGSGHNRLTGVDALSANDVWAVGYYSDVSGQTLIEHWDGTAWSIVPSPNAGTSFNHLFGVAAVSANDVWAVGNYYAVGFTTQTLIEHWNGTAWSIVPSPNTGSGFNILSGITALSTSDVWAVGTHYPNGSTMQQTLIERWNGSTWSVVPSPNFGTRDSALNGIAAVSANNIWAVGNYHNGSVYRTLTEQWNGTAWNIVLSPNTGYSDELYGVAAVSANDVWAVGRYSGDFGIDHVLTEHWNGAAWSIVPNSLDSNGATLYGVAAVAANDVWAVGGYVNGSVEQTLVERYNPCFAPSPTPTSCPIQFTDVPSTDTFYQFVRCLACRGIISGYADGTFKPNNLVTRGQLAKIVSNAAGYTESPDPHIFEDVPASNTFYQWINRLARRGHMSGYQCGGVGEPCTTGRPYFRPFANATRGQTSKIVSNAAGFPEIPTEQAFEDVPTTHTFYMEIQRLASRNIMQGYPCGGVGEPCLSGRPYFRPANNVTRGQSAKIVANTFFPECQTP